ncbi:MAG: leucine-rich repeat domain-containing protein, partial [Clostridia bacterium]|nr:leucine-rich repeat domain-containing protein [Clostridia bacterium]
GEQSIVWTLADNHLVISGTGAMADSYYGDLPWWDSHQTITDVTIGEGVTRIGKHAFYSFQSLAEISIPASVESIGYEAFRSGTVSSVTFAPNSRLTTIDDYAFNYLVSLKQIILPASVESIGDGAFASCGALETVTFEEGSRLSSLGYKPFFCCYSLTAISIPESVTACKTIDGVLYSGDGTTLLLYPAGKTDEAFTTPAGVTTIAESALYYVQFRTVTLSEGVTTIGNDAFFGCNSMQSVSLPSTLTSIGSYAFEGCSALTTVNAPCSWDGSLYTFADTVTVNAILHRGGTANCEQGAVCGDCGEVYTDLDPDNHTYASGICCGYCGAEGDRTNLTWTLKDGMLTISGTGAMADYASSGVNPWYDARQTITDVTIGNGVTHIGTWAFAQSGAETITFAANSQLTTIGYHAFDGSSLWEITIPASVETIGYRAFMSCYNLSSVTFAEGSRLTSIGEECFGHCSALLAIIVPEDNTAYKTIDGVLYSGDGTTLIQYPADKAGESFTTPAGVTTISDYAFKPNDSIRYLTLSEGVTTIGSYAISYCYDLTEVTIPASVTSIGKYAFRSCSALTTVNAPCSWDGSLYTFEDTVTVNVADHAFADGVCTACGAVCEHPGYEEGFCTQCGEICAHTFSGGTCTTCGLTGGYCGASTNEGGEQSVTWTLSDNHLVISGTGAMADSFYGNLPWHDALDPITAVTIGEGVTHIGKHAFYNFQSLTEISIPASVESIGYEAFSDCTMSSVAFA